MITNYTELQAAVSNWANRTDLSSRIPEFIALCEADMQVRCKLVDFEGVATIVITSGSGSLPADYSGARSLYWDGNLDRPLSYVPPAQFDALRNESGGSPTYYTIRGTSLLVDQNATGNVVMTYKAQFTPLSGSVATNTLLTRFPDAYLYGSLIHLCGYVKDAEGMAGATAMYEGALRRIIADDNARRFAGPLQVRAR